MDTLHALLQGVVTKLKSTNPLCILDNEVFDPLYSASRNGRFVELDARLRTQVFRAVLKAVANLAPTISAVLEDVQGQPHEQSQVRNAVQMYVLLLNWMASPSEQEALKVTKHKEQAKTDWNWADERIQCLAAINLLLELNISQLWPMSCTGEAFVSAITRMVYLFLENPNCIKCKASKEYSFKILAELVRNYNHTLGAITSVIHLLPHFEHLVSPFAQFVELVMVNNENSVMVSEILREIGRMDTKDMARDTSGTRFTATFLVELAERLPKAVLESLSVLFPLLDGESYTMRNAILSIMAAILSKVLVSDRSESGIATRDQFMDILQQRLYDTSAYVRGRALQIWAMLATENAIPLSRRPQLMAEVAGRLEDKSSQVRKQALQLVTVLLTRNPYGAQLSLAQLKTQLSEAKTKLATLTASEPADPDLISSVAISAQENKVEGTGEEESDLVEQRVNQEELALAEQRVRVAYHADAVLFAEQIEHVIVMACQLLGSKTISDVTEAVGFFVACEQFAVQGAPLGVRKMLALVWSKEAAAKDALLQAYDELYLQPANVTGKNRSALIARNLITLTAGCNLGDLTSFEELLGTLMTSGRIDAGVIDVLWDVFAKCVPNITDAQSRGALIILGMIARARPEIIQDNISLLVTTGLGPRAAEDFQLVRHTCTALQHLCSVPPATGSGLTEPVRLPTNHSLFVKMMSVVITSSPEHIADWHAALEQVINTIYCLAEHPDHLCAELVEKLAAPCFGAAAPPTISSVLLERLLFAVGHVALKQLVHLDYIEAELKRRHVLQDDREDLAKKKSRKDKSTAGADEAEEDDMGVGGASAEDEEAELMHRIAERELILGENTLLSQYVPVLLTVCQQMGHYADPGLLTSATLALCKFMCVSSVFCEEHLPLLFTIMRDSQVPAIRTNCMIALGDLAFRFPNILEPWTAHLYGRLRDSDARVRKTALMVLTHLILNDMIKVKGQISEMAICLEDTEQRISDLARLFFFELAQKGNAIYNILPDVISQLSDAASGVTPTMFTSITEYLFTFIAKDKQAESLVEKLCHRFRTTTELQHWRNFAQCLSFLPYSDKSIKKLQEQFQCYHDKLGDDIIFAAFQKVLDKGRKFAKPELKEALDELGDKMAACHSKGAENDATASNAEKAKKKKGKRLAAALRQVRANLPATLEETEEASPLKAVKKSAPTKDKKKKAFAPPPSDSESDEVNTFNVSEEDEETENVPPRKTAMAKRGAASRGRRVAAVHSDED